MLSDFICTGQLVDELTRLRQAYTLLEDIHAYAGTDNLKSVLRDVDEFFTKEEEC